MLSTCFRCSELGICHLAILLSMACIELARAIDSYGSISGTVTDSSGAAVPAANVTLTEPQHFRETNAGHGPNDGHFTFVN